MGAGPLAGIRVVEFAGIGPGPFCAMLLSDMGAEVLRIDRKGSRGAHPKEVPARGRQSLALDLKSAADAALVKKILAQADVLIEGFRPGVMERLGLGPETILALNPRLIYGRMTGWGQTGPLAQAAGHDINYIALTGALDAMGDARQPPCPPLNLVGDFGGGALYLAFGIAAALVERSKSGLGQVIDAAIVDGTASLMAPFHWFAAMDVPVSRGENFLGGAAHYYRVYCCADGKYISIGPIEPHFFALLIELVGTEGVPAGLLPPDLTQKPEDWMRGSEALAAVFSLKSRDEWCRLLEGTDVCFAPVLSLAEAPDHPHMRARGVYRQAFDIVQPGPAPRLSRTPGAIQGPPPAAGEGGAALIAAWGVMKGS